MRWIYASIFFFWNYVIYYCCQCYKNTNSQTWYRRYFKLWILLYQIIVLTIKDLHNQVARYRDRDKNLTFNISFKELYGWLDLQKKSLNILVQIFPWLMFVVLKIMKNDQSNYKQCTTDSTQLLLIIVQVFQG